MAKNEVFIIGKTFVQDFEALLGKYNVKVAHDSEFLEQGTTIAYMQEGYIKRGWSLHFEEMLPATKENLKEVDEVCSRESNVGDFM